MSVVADVAHDAADAAVEDTVVDTVEVDDGSLTAPFDVDVSTEDVGAGPQRVWANRAIGGISMGAAAAIIGLRNPDKFAIAAGLGS